MIIYFKFGAGYLQKVTHCFVFDTLQSPHMELSKYQTLPGKLKSKKSELRVELNGDREGDGEYLSPVRLSPVHSHDQDYSLSEFL